MNFPDLTVITVSFNSANDLPGFVESLRAGAHGIPYTTVFVDNASTDDSVDVARQLGVRCVSAGDNIGYGAGVNLARQLVDDRTAILVANPDVRFKPGSVARLVHASLATGNVCVPQVVDAQGSPRPSLRREPTLGRQLGEALLGDRLPHRPRVWSIIVRDPRSYAVAQKVDWATGAAVLIPAKCNRTVGDWPQQYFLYSEEVEFCWNARHAGFDIEYVPDAVVFHQEGGSGRSAGLVALDAVNRVRYFRGHHGTLSSYAYGGLVLLEKVLRSTDHAERLAARTVLSYMGRPLARNQIPDGRHVLNGLRGGRDHSRSGGTPGAGELRDRSPEQPSTRGAS